ncbi:PREDICTED: serine/threonine-protein kinase rio2-like [Lupinus angustifolius]|uniref:serine/threonine-protein kinase rio2-like n=1 Tax=Lupinus angustifolius TaxID=3871 RepID=UPI00092E2876|nr:PREDICTED: serine/threonine-protein kinase rio2-like [Lupinus angustifolius]
MEKAMTDSLERSLQNCSLNNNHTEKEEEKEEEDDDVLIVDNHHHHHVSNSDTTLDLNSHVSLPYHWEQCLDLKTGEIYYINWRNGMKAKEDPRSNNRNEESEEEEESWDDSEESSSSESCCPSSSFNNNKEYHQNQNQNQNNNVLVVAGCKSCLMYFMVPKQVEDCPKCTGQLLHFDRSQTNDPTSPSPSPSP